ncbi:hypothetical protein P691DRAFT_854337, partial [Macrolepiota fuliginosa MF-IS2]
MLPWYSHHTDNRDPRLVLPRRSQVGLSVAEWTRRCGQIRCGPDCRRVRHRQGRSRSRVFLFAAQQAIQVQRSLHHSCLPAGYPFLWLSAPRHCEARCGPDLLEKTPRVQFRKLIVEPLLLLSHERKRVIILDGLDECDGESNQLEIIELINNLLHSNTSFPIIWMICSRSESHLKRTFARSDYAMQCWREFLPIDSEESRSDTETFIRGRFREIHDQYGEYVEEDVDGCWPPEATTERIIEKSSGLFVLADTLLKHIEDAETHDPDERLGEVLAFLKHSYLTGSRNPMHDLDLFYTHILSLIPDDHWSTVRQILVASTFRSPYSDRLAVQPMCNLLGISRTKFYAAMRRLHSVINIPEPSDATYTPPHFFHATFLDYLTNPNRAGRFFIGRIVTDYRITIAAGLWDFVLSELRCLGSTIGLAEINQNRLEVWGNPEISLLLKQ